MTPKRYRLSAFVATGIAKLYFRTCGKSDEFASFRTEPRTLYLKYRAEKDVADHKPWDTVILEDFAELRRAGLSNPLMDEIEKQFTP